MKKKPTGAIHPEAPVVFSTEVLRRVRQHARSSMSAEICGVLIGEISAGSTVVETLIEGEAAQQGGSHVTFTQDTWAHIYQTKDSKFPDKRIVGWYHSHPGFGVFLSDHDTFIQRNFFSDARQVAWVYDPHSDEEGCFAWKGEEIVRLPQIELRDESPAEPGQPRPESGAESPVERLDAPQPATSRGRSAAKYLALFFSYLLVAFLGFVAAALLVPRVIVVPAGDPRLEFPAPPPASQNK